MKIEQSRNNLFEFKLRNNLIVQLHQKDLNLR